MVKILNINFIETTFTNLNPSSYKTDCVFITNINKLMFRRQIATGKRENPTKLSNIFSGKNAKFS
jgi:hypothetical protein